MSRGRRYGNRLVYLCVLIFFFTMAWAYGGAMLYLSLYALLLLPVFSYILTFIALRLLKVTQRTKHRQLLKDEPGRYEIEIHNRTPFMFGHIECQFIDDHFAVETDREWQTVFARPFSEEKHTIDFCVRYRGHYRLGLYALRTADMLGIFTLKKRLNETIALTVWPKLVDITDFPLARNILSQSNSNFEIREEDYAVVSDIRRYVPTDPLKRVHWKLTAKKNEWMVKDFQTNALNRVTVLTDTFKPSIVYEDALILEDKIIETTVAVINFCLHNGMPVDWYARADIKRSAHNAGNFDALFGMAADLIFDGQPETASVIPMLNKCITETSGYINAVIFTANPTADLYDRIINAQRMGHSFSVLYFMMERKISKEAEEIFRRLTDSGITSFKITPETDVVKII